MDHVDATIALELVGDYWPGKALNADQTERWAAALGPYDFERTCEHLEHLGRTQQHPPTLAELCAALAPAPQAWQPEPHADGWMPTDRGRALAQHARRLLERGTQRKELHDHRKGWERCPVCSEPGDYRRCGEPTCPVCATP